MILIEGIPVVAARLVAEQKAKDWLSKTRRRATNTSSEKSPVGRPLAAASLSAKAA
jgi:hypothetical protein